jgi:dipeptidyl-peptidase-4
MPLMLQWSLSLKCTFSLILLDSGFLVADTRTFDWVQDASKDGQHITFNAQGAVVIEDIVTQKQTILVPGNKIPANHREMWVNKNLTKVLFSVNARKQYRYSYFADYLIHDVASGNTEPLTPDQKGDVQYAVWSPTTT